MKHDDAKQEAQAQWDKWHELQSQIKDLEYLVTKGDKLLEQYRARLAELRGEEDAVRRRFESMLKKLRE